VYHLQWLSLKLTKYSGQLDRNLGDVRPPDPHEIINCIQEQKQWVPNLTETFRSRYNLRAFLGLHARAFPASLPSVESTSASSTVSGLTPPSGVATD
jgi:hypothetical protein